MQLSNNPSLNERHSVFAMVAGEIIDIVLPETKDKIAYYMVRLAVEFYFNMMTE